MGEQSRSSRAVRRPSRQQPAGSRPVIRFVVLLAIGVGFVAMLGTLASSGDDAGDGARQPAAQRQQAGPDDNAVDQDQATKPLRATYRVKQGDSFASISEQTGVPVETLQELNPEIDPRALQPGQKLKLK